MATKLIYHCEICKTVFVEFVDTNIEDTCNSIDEGNISYRAFHICNAVESARGVANLIGLEECD